MEAAQTVQTNYDEAATPLDVAFGGPIATVRVEITDEPEMRLSDELGI
jgi:hypothetical protein